MPCVHLTQLYQLCRDSQLQLSSADLIHIVCKQCNQAEVCPNMLYEQYDELVSNREAAKGDQAERTEMEATKSEAPQT